ncbi:MAG: excinuclease ABC subunit UvrA [Bacteroidales bacterium]|nr:excinuclease ABC subunit UvrA [Bacteroidales bacterium]
MAADNNDYIENEETKIEIYGAREHNLKNVDLTIPRNSLVVFTGLSGSGKSSLAFDTIYAEGQRRYIETFSAYARQFLGGGQRPNVDKITGLSPVISIEQKTTNNNPRSTVGTVTEIYDFFRLLYARAGEARSYATGEKMVKYTEDQILDLILDAFDGKRVYLLSPLVKGRKGHYKEVFEQIRKRGYLYARVDGEIKEVTHGMKLDRYKSHFIELMVDKMRVERSADATDAKRMKQSIELALRVGKGVMMVVDADDETGTPRYFSRQLMCPTTGISYSEPAPHNFSFNSPQGACPKCKGLGSLVQIDIEKIIPDPKKSIADGGIEPVGKQRNTLVFAQLDAISEKYGFTLKTPIEEISEEAMDTILYGTPERLTLKNESGLSNNFYPPFDGIINYIDHIQESTNSAKEKKWATQFAREVECPECHGQRLNREALHFFIDGKNIADVAKMDMRELYEWLEGIEDRLDSRQKAIATEILKEIRSRIGFLLDVGLDYLSMNRSAVSLSGGESQRIRLATQIGSQLVNVLYILDEPSIGLHQRDNVRLINSLKALRDSGNSVIVVEHDRDMMMQADYLVDVGPGAGRKGGHIVASGKPEEIVKLDTMTAQYLSGRMNIEVPKERRKGSGKTLVLRGCTGNNLKNVDVTFPLGTLICMTGVSGSGKSTLVNETLQPILSQKFYRSLKDPMPYESIEGVDNIDKIVAVDQTPIGRTPRSNPATYTGLFDDIRKLFGDLPESKLRNYKIGRFSFNVCGGRCETCKGAGVQVIEMSLLPDVMVECPDCRGKRYNRETLEVKFKGKSIGDILQMTINMAAEFFENIPSISHKLKTLQSVGLGYITLGQPSTTLSGGESQRIKLATELARKDTGNTLYLLDEPTTGLHFEDIRILMDVINKLVDKGNTVVVIEHNLDVIKMADYIVDMGPEGGRNGGTVLACGTPEEIVAQAKGYTWKFLKEELEK